MGNAFRQGEHICALYETEAEQLEVAAEYLADGLRAGERAFYVAGSEAALSRFRAVLNRQGINVPTMVKRGALVEATHAEAHLAGGSFSSERMLRLLNEAIETALKDGFTGLRACGDMSWLLTEPEGAHLVVEYESLLNQFFNGVHGAGMCQYDIRRLRPHLIEGALATHTSVVVDRHHKSNRFYRPPSIAASRTSKPSDVSWKLTALRERT
jgi:hypothetical protein